MHYACAPMHTGSGGLSETQYSTYLRTVSLAAADRLQIARQEGKNCSRRPGQTLKLESSGGSMRLLRVCVRTDRATARMHAASTHASTWRCEMPTHFLSSAFQEIYPLLRCMHAFTFASNAITQKLTQSSFQPAVISFCNMQ